MLTLTLLPHTFYNCMCPLPPPSPHPPSLIPPKQVLAFLRVFVQQSLAAFRSHSPSSIAGLPEPEAQAYVVRFMREYLSQAWYDKLAGSYSFSTSQQQSLSEYHHMLREQSVYTHTSGESWWLANLKSSRLNRCRLASAVP